MKYLSRVCILMFTTLLFACSPPSQPNADTATASSADSASTNTAESGRSAQPCSLTMGFDAWEPYQYIGVGNVVTGLDVEIVRAVAHEMNCLIQTQQATWVELLQGVRSGNIDLVLGASFTEDRDAFAHFSDPYREEQFVLYVRQGEGRKRYDSIEEFVSAGNTLGIVNEYYYGDDIRALTTNSEFADQFMGAVISELNMARLIDEDIDGFLEDHFVGASILRRKGLDAYIEPHGLNLGSSPVYVMFSKASVSWETVSAFNQALARVKTSGRYQEIVDKYDL
ncbi:substrate-binding periplasmic protein [Aliidiomarina celeris]|uniref:substrate-binding periplasmic protein n=1 Tax=Aliidiomarina celeris TaxID=2249428 RepID=UPI0018E5B29A|nr:transporter substrate-binding domain-containing protein [Aliidiomarina celeris]